MMDMTGGGGGSTACPPVPNTATMPSAADPHTLANMLQERFVVSSYISHFPYGTYNCLLSDYDKSMLMIVLYQSNKSNNVAG